VTSFRRYATAVSVAIGRSTALKGRAKVSRRSATKIPILAAKIATIASDIATLASKVVT